VCRPRPGRGAAAEVPAAGRPPVPEGRTLWLVHVIRTAEGWLLTRRREVDYVRCASYACR